MEGQLELFEAFPLRTPCERHCECEWCSLMCFEKRGQFFDRVNRDWIRDSQGNILTSKNRVCDWEPSDHPEIEL